MRTFLACAVMIILCAVGAEAQVEMQLGGEVGFPMTPEGFTEGWSAAGFGGGVGVGVQVLPIATLSANFNYTRVGLDEDGIKQWLIDFGFSPADLAQVSFDGGAVSIVYVSGGGKVYMNEGTSPRVYFVAGLGFYRLSVSDLDIRQGSDVGTVTVEAENALGLNGGVGVDIAVGDNVNMFVEGQYVVGFTEGDSTGHIPVRVGLLFKIGS